MIVNENSTGINHSSREIDQCISVLENLAKDTEQLVNLPEEQRIALLKVAGELSSSPIEKKHIKSFMYFKFCFLAKNAYYFKYS